MSKPITLDQIRDMAQEEADRLGSRRALAMQLRISPAHMSNFLNGLRGPGPRLLEHFGVAREIRYVRTTAEITKGRG